MSDKRNLEAVQDGDLRAGDFFVEGSALTVRLWPDGVLLRGGVTDPEATERLMGEFRGRFIDAHLCGELAEWLRCNYPAEV